MSNKAKHSTLFISHALPEDNTFVRWLASRLTLLGYVVWCEIFEQSGGEDFWLDIEHTIQEKSIKFLAVVSKTSIKPEKRGVRNELAAAAQIIDRGDFIIPLKIDDVSYTQFPIEMKRKNAIDFSHNWADGLYKLIQKLEKDGVDRESNTLHNISLISNDNLLRRDEKYWTNWIEFTPPQYIYLHKLSSVEFEKIDEIQSPFVSYSNLIITFACAECVNIHTIATQKILTKDFLAVAEFDTKIDGYKIRETRRIVNELYNKIFDRYLQNMGLKEYKLSSRPIYYFEKDRDKHLKVSMTAYGRLSIQLTGTNKEYVWHYAIAGQSFQFPLNAFWLSHHLVFTHNGRVVNPSQQHSLGRKLRKDWYNKKWRDMLLGALIHISGQEPNSKISIPVCCSQYMVLNNTPMFFVSPTGYKEPK